MFLDTPVKHHSSGMYVRLAFAVAAHLEPEILIVDEVLAVGDAQFQKKCLGKMEDVSRGGRTVLFVSHQMGVVASLCSTGILLNAGCVVAIGGMQELIGNYLNLASNVGFNYHIDPKKIDRSKNQIISVQIESENRAPGKDFSYSEHVYLTIKLSLPFPSSGLLFGVGLDNAGQFRVFTVLRETSRFKKIDHEGCYLTRLKLPRQLIAPGSYSFTLALFEYKGFIYDHLLNICPIHIRDDGSPYARFEGMDYGSVIVDACWID
jgi:lipopolysaccharide transport system ATP-binding protein